MLHPIHHPVAFVLQIVWPLRATLLHRSMRIFQFKTPLAWWVRFRKMAKSANDVDELSAIFEESSSSNNSIFDQIWRLLGSKRPPLFRAERENLWDHGNRGGVWLFKFRASNFITPSNLQILLAEMRRTKWMESVYGNMRLSLICSYRANTLPWRANTWTFMLIMLNVECWMLNVECWMLNDEFEMKFEFWVWIQLQAVLS